MSDYPEIPSNSDLLAAQARASQNTYDLRAMIGFYSPVQEMMVPTYEERLRHNTEENMRSMRRADERRELICWAVIVFVATIAVCFSL